LPFIKIEFKNLKTIIFYYDGTYTATSTNLGNKKNTIIVYNDTKYIFNNKLDSTGMTLGAIDAYNNSLKKLPVDLMDFILDDKDFVNRAESDLLQFTPSFNF
jgi:hypothetical protein